MYSFAGPAEVKGKYQTIRDWLQPVLIVIFLVTPWVTIGGRPVLLFDFLNRHFVIFGTSFFSHDAPLLFFLVIILALAIFLTTAIFGRQWCGWSCPQTVFIHAVFNKVEKWIMGPYAKRTLQYRQGGSQNNIRLLFLYLSFLLICWVLAHSFVAYFAGADVVTRYISEGPALHLQAFTVLMVMTGLIFFNFVIFREKFCRSVCPYGRFQNTLIDTNTVVVFYNALRGEPRAKKGSQVAEKGDCLDCNRCVAVCPVKIDIREGFQQECISCAKCIDACNDVMLKTARQPSLIRYETGDRKKMTFKRFRLVLYTGLISIFTGALVWSIEMRSDIDFGVTRSSA
ncbi:MAG: cytochrome c oxidase accessory protein CcoG, partial [Bdellovibrionaceae bacterium]|nr:cytochrome c oxidase accessory protein CcoG [Pseudobdellovibrionaceae bacterium]